MKRQCGECQLCCKLLPVRSPLLDKESNTKCRYQKFGVGCTVYRTHKMPFECGAWKCRWLVNDDTAQLSRPDRSHYVVDLMPDFITVKPNDDAVQPTNFEVIQVWVDRKYPDAWRDPDLLAYLARRGFENKAALIRYGASESFVLLPPAMCGDGKFHDTRDEPNVNSVSIDRTHHPAEIIDALGDMKFITSMKD